MPKRKRIYNGKIIEVFVDTLDVAGRSVVREVVRHPHGVVVLAVLEDGRIPFVRQHRYAVGQSLLELPAGKVDPGEMPVHSASRELEEETSYRPTALTHVFSFYPTPRFCNEVLHLFYTEQLRKTTKNTEFDEDPQLELYTHEEAMELCARGKIRDGKILLAFVLVKVQNKVTNDSFALPSVVVPQPQNWLGSATATHLSVLRTNP